MVYTLIDYRNDVIKCSKLKWWNQEPQASGFTAKFWTIYGVISMVYKSVDHGKLSVVNLFLTTTFIFCFPRRFFFVVFRIFFVFLQLQAPTHCQKCLPMCWNLVLLCPCWGIKLFSWKTKTKTTRTAWHVTSFPWTILSQTMALDHSAREDSLSYCENPYGLYKGVLSRVEGLPHILRSKNVLIHVVQT